MNWEKGLGRITFVVAVVVAIPASVLSVILTLEKHSSENHWVRWKRENYVHKYDIETFTKDGIEFLPDNPTKTEINALKAELEKKHTELRNRATLSTKELFELMPETKELLDLENSFWVNLSTAQLKGLCILCGIAGAAIGYGGIVLVIWFGGLAVYKLIRWIVLGFTADNDKPKEEQKQ